MLYARPFAASSFAPTLLLTFPETFYIRKYYVLTTCQRRERCFSKFDRRRFKTSVSVVAARSPLKDLLVTLQEAFFFTLCDYFIVP